MEPRNLDDSDASRRNDTTPSRLRALWTVWSGEVRVLSGALGKPRTCGAFSSSGYTLCVCPTVDVPGWAATTPNIRTTYLEAPLRGGEFRGGLTAQEHGAQEGECEEHDDPDSRAARG